VTDTPPRIVVLGLGNDILGDDAVGLVTARRLRAVLPATVDVIESGGGLDLLDLLEGYDRALLLDAILTGKHPPGTIFEFAAADLKNEHAPSPHYAGLSTVLRLADSLEIHFPSIFQIVAVEIENPYEVIEALSARVEAAIPSVISRARSILEGWVPGARTSSNPPSFPPTHPFLGTRCRL
jgi:hydrogenase maturation protease